MNCLNVDKIYLFLENEISSSEREKIEQHIAVCHKCRLAVEERKILLQASESLPLWEVPHDFTQKVMAEISLQRSPLKSALLAAAIIFSSLTTLVFFYLFMTGQNLMSFFIGVNGTALSMIRNISTTAVRIFKIASAVVRALGDLFSFFLQAFLKLTAIISPEIQIVFIFISLIATIALFVTLRKKLLLGERT